MKEDGSRSWLAMACFCALWTIINVFSGGDVALPVLMCATALVCSVNPGARGWLMDKLSWTFSGSSVRLMLVMIGVMVLWQVVGLELAMFAAGDVLAYLEVLTAVSLMAAQTRLAPVKAAMARRFAQVMRRAMRLRPRRRTRRIRPRTPPPSNDVDGPAGVWAFA